LLTFVSWIQVFVKLLSKIYKQNIFDILKDIGTWNNLESPNSNLGLTYDIWYVILG